VRIPCSDRSYFYKYVAECDRRGDAEAVCDMRQPETGSRSISQFRRSAAR
jgi:hypothetical protein